MVQKGVGCACIDADYASGLRIVGKAEFSTGNAFVPWRESRCRAFHH